MKIIEECDLSFFPTNAGKVIAKRADIHKHLATELDLGSAISDFQRMAAISEPFEDCLFVLEYWLEKDLTEDQNKALELIYEITKREVSGIVFEKVADIMVANKDSLRLDAARLLKELKDGDSTATGNTVKKIIFELDKESNHGEGKT